MEGEQQTMSVAGVPKKSKLGLIIGIVLILIILGGGAYYVFGRNSSTGSGGGILSAVTPKTLNPNCKYNDPDLCKFMNNWKEVKYLTMTSSDTTSGSTNSFVYKMEGDTKSQMISTENGKETYSVISIDKTTYTKDYTDNKWWKYTQAETKDDLLSDTKSEIDFDAKAESVEDKTTYTKIGTEACGKYTCFKYKVVDPANTESTEYIYFDNKEYQLRKTRTEMKDGSVSEATYDYSKLSISAPSPTKEGDPYSNSTGVVPITTTPVTTTTPSTTPSTSTSSSSSSSGAADVETETPASSELPVSDYNVAE